MVKVKCYSWNGNTFEGLTLVSDPRLGSVIFLGEDGRGRHFEKIGLDRRNPPPVDGDRVMNATLSSFELPAKDGRPEKNIFRLEREPADEGTQLPAAIVRINCCTGYRRDASGNWRTVSGEPKRVIEGRGAFGDAGRIGGWSDSLVIMTKGDVIKITPTCEVGGVKSFALWMEGNEVKTASWQDWENLQAVSKAEAIIAEAATAARGLATLFGMMPCSTYVGYGEFRDGIDTAKGATGTVIALGESGRGRKLVEVPIVGIEAGAAIAEIGVAELSRSEAPPRWYGDKPSIKVSYGLIVAGRREIGVHLVRVRPGLAHRAHTGAETLAGSPVEVGYGNVADGIAGNMSSAVDALYVLKPGDALKMGSSRVIANVAGELQAPLFGDWELAQAELAPEGFIAQGRVPFGRVPAEWVGRIVSVVRRETYEGRRGPAIHWPEGDKGELISLQPLVMNLGWDGRDRHLVTPTEGAWVKLHEELQAKPLEGEDAIARATAKAEVLQVQTEAKAVSELPYFRYFGGGLQSQIGQIIDGRELSAWGNPSEVAFDTLATEDIVGWVSRAREVLVEAQAGDAEARQAAAARSEQDRAEAAASAHRAEIVEQLQQLPPAYVRVLYLGGRAFVSTGRRLDGMEITPARGTIETRSESLDPKGRDNAWIEAVPGQQVRIREMSRKGNVNSEETVTLPTSLADGVWALAQDDGGELAYSVIFYRDRCEVIPTAMTVVRPSVKLSTVAVAPTAMPVVAAEVVPAVFTHLAKRDFRCPSGHSARLTSSEYAQYQAGQTVPITCTICGAKGEVKLANAG